MAEAVNYALSPWKELNLFCSDGAVRIDNNVSEQERKRVVLNRKNSLLRWQSTWRRNAGDSGQPHRHLPPARCRPAAVSHPVADELIAGAQKRTAQLAPRPVEAASGGTPAFVADVLRIALTLDRTKPESDARFCVLPRPSRFSCS